MSIEALHALHTFSGHLLPADFLSKHRTVEDIAAALGSETAIPDRNDSPESREGVMTPSRGSLRLPDATVNNGHVSSQAVRDVVAAVLGVPVGSLTDHRDLAELGMDSLMSIEMRHVLRTQFDIALPDDFLTHHRTISDISDLLSAHYATQRLGGDDPDVFGGLQREVERSLIKLQEGQGPPLFLIHDGSGTAIPYSRLEPLGCPVWGIQNPKLESGTPWTGGLVEMAGHYSNLIRSVLSADSACVVGGEFADSSLTVAACLLSLGWSLGGVIAYEVARRLTVLGTYVHGLILIDSPHPLTDKPLPDAMIDTIFPGRSGHLARTQMRLSTKALVQYDPFLTPNRHAVLRRIVALRSREGFDMPSSTTPLDSFLQDRSNPRAAVDVWERVTELSIPIIDIPGDHFSVFAAGNVSLVYMA